MKRILLLFLSLTAMLSYAQDAHKTVSAVDQNKDTHYYYYNTQNQLIWELVGTTRYEFEYNAAGQRTKRQTYLWVSNPGEYQKSNYETYEYDADGNVVKTTVMKKPWNKTDYEEDDVFQNYIYEDGFAKSWDNYYKGTLYYNFRNVLTKGDNGDVTKVVTERFDPDAPEKGWVTSNTLTYTYADLAAKYAPANLSIDSNNGNVTLNWSPVEGATSYVVSYDNERDTIKGSTTFSVILGTGNRQFAVQAIVDGVERNASFCNLSVQDPGKKAITDLVVGEITQVEEETESEDLKTRTFYLIPLTWTLPEGHSVIEKFNIYYNSKAYGNNCSVSQVDPAATSFTLKIDPFEVAEWDENGNLSKGIETPIYVTIVYTTGESEKSNVVTVNPFKLLGGESTAISSLNVNLGSEIIYNVAGQRISSAKGIVIKNGKKYIIK